MAKAPKLSREEKMMVEAFKPMWELGLRCGCPTDQLANFTKANFLLQPKQLEMSAAARACDIRCKSCTELYEKGLPIKKDCNDCGPIAVGIGGARGGGKSSWMVAQVALDDCQRFPGLSFLYVRKSAKTLRKQMRELLRKTCLPDSYNYREQVGEVVFKTGSTITIRHFKDESEIDNFLGEEYDGIGYEELTTLSNDKFSNLNSCLRTSKKGWRPRIYASWNWGGIGHSWVKSFFYDPWKENREITTRYILALVSDNKHNNPEYVNQLKDFVGWKYQSWYLGNPDFSAGNFFTNFRDDVHVYPNEQTQLNESTIVRWFGSLDYGSSHPNAMYLHGEDDNGDIYTVGELHTIGNTIAENCEEYRDMLRLKNLEVSDLEFVAAGHDVSKTDRKTREDGSTIATEFQENGVGLSPVYINRVEAWSQLQERLGNSERGIRPKWFIHRSCTNLIEQIKTAQCDLKKPNDIIKQNADKETGEGGDDGLESARNGIVLAYSSLLTNAKPVKMGNYESLAESSAQPEYQDTEEIIREAEVIDFELNRD